MLIIVKNVIDSWNEIVFVRKFVIGILSIIFVDMLIKILEIVFGVFFLLMEFVVIVKVVEK